MKSVYPYQELLRDASIGPWRSFKRVNAQLQKKSRLNIPAAEEVFAMKVILDEQWNKWFFIATNEFRTNSRTKTKIRSLWASISDKYSFSDSIAPLKEVTFWKQNRIKIFLQVLNLDFFIYGDSLRTNFARESKWQTFFEASRRNLALSITNNLLFYGLPIFLISLNPLFLSLLIASILGQVFFGYQRTVRFYYLNEINKVLTQPNNVYDS